MKNIIIIAPPGAGKGTQCELLTQNYHYLHLSTGDLLRNIVKSDSPLASIVSKEMENGGYVSDDTVIALVKEYLEKNQGKHIIFDGFPRTLQQAEVLDKLLKDLGSLDYIVIYISIDKETAINRIIGRRICEKCGAIYNITSPELTPIVENTCNKCKSPLIIRSDDTPEVYEKRYQEYMDKTSELLTYYQNKNILFEITGDEPMEKFKNIENIMRLKNDHYQNN